jgi:WD40 repeat protein
MPTATPSSTPTLTPTITPSSTPLLLAEAGTPLPGSLAPVTYRSAEQVSGLAAWSQETLTDLAWSPDGSILVAAGLDGLHVYDPQQQQRLRVVETENDVFSLAFNPRGDFLAAGYRFGSEKDGYGGSVEFWRTASWEALGTFYSENQAVSSVAYAPTGKSFAAAFTSQQAADNRILIWDTFTWEISQTLRTGNVLEIAYSPSGQQVATSPDRFAIKIWNLRDSRLLNSIYTSFTGTVNCLEYSPNGAWIASGHYDGAIRIWDSQSGQLVRTLQADGVVESLAFNTDGTVLAAGYSYVDNAVRLWDAETGLLLRTLEGHQAAIESLVFSPGGSMLASGSYDGAIRLWGVRP